ncbi:hypothetical protein PILCRDRAFT_7621 [Piloderma croceum F 1598]|uniref:DUF4219 domain-containing protein n=1 Tax=Piloderma croceum (strain F 1598) TaxID=765440 RepID=A0A0C3FSR3_PILCF|nr:hypothetical protein PILCRDRAFT_7621 [Piloderma croceum F 1598]
MSQMEHSISNTIEKLTHSNYHAWASHAESLLWDRGVWRFCTGDEDIPTKPVRPGFSPTTTPAKIATGNRKHKEDLCTYADAIHRNDKAIRTIRLIVEHDQLEHTDGKDTAREVWDALKEKHKGANMGLAAFYIKVGMLEKKYVEGMNMHTHISFFTTENHKLGNKAFDDEFLAQILLMSLP